MTGSDERDSGPARASRPTWTSRLGGASRASKISLAATAAGLLAVIVAISIIPGSSAGTRQPPAAKNFTLPALGHPASKVTLAAYAGKPVIINFFASWCAPCKRETPLLARFYRQHAGRVVIVGVDANDQSGPARRFVRANGVSYPVGFDPLPAAVTISYDVLALPQTFFLNSRHQIVKRIYGDVTMQELTAGVGLMDRSR